MNTGAGDGNRTHATSLEGWDSTIELHPHIQRVVLYHKVVDLSIGFFENTRKIFIIPKQV